MKRTICSLSEAQAIAATVEAPEGWKACPVNMGVTVMDPRSSFVEEPPGSLCFTFRPRPPLFELEDWKVYLLPEELTVAQV